MMEGSSLATSPATPTKGQKQKHSSEQAAGTVDASTSSPPAKSAQSDYFAPQKDRTSPHPSTPSRSTDLTDSSESPLSQPESQQSADTPKARQGSHEMQDTPIRKSTASTPSISSPTPSTSSALQPSTASRTCAGSHLQSSPIYTTPKQFRSAENSKSRAASATPTSSKFSFLSSKMAALKSFTSPYMNTTHNGDELAELDIEASLFPARAPNDDDCFSPAAFKNLQMTATGLASKFQTAYQNQSAQLRTAKAEKEALEDEKDEAETRVRHFKMQLEEMARKLAETESQMQMLMDELNREKKTRMNHRYSRDSRLAPSEVSIISEDLGVEHDQQKKLWRRSGDTDKTDNSFETDDESMESSSVFSRSRSPTLAASLSDMSPLETSLPPARTRTLDTNPKCQQMTTFQKLMKGISGEGEQRTVPECRNCKGQDASVAWDTAGLLRDENRGLKLRVTDLESALEGALDVVNGIGM